MTKLVLQVPRYFLYTISMLNEVRQNGYEQLRQPLWCDFQDALKRLNSNDPDGVVYCWIRRRTNAHYEQCIGGYLEGSSDVTCHMFELFRSYAWSGDVVNMEIDEKFGFWINGEIVDHLGLPRTRATEEYHDKERA